MSAQPKFTPGPWVVGPVDDTVVTYVGKDGKRYEVAQIDGDYNQPETWPVMEANARLIAAAPEMYEALSKLVTQTKLLGVAMNTDLEPFVALGEAVLAKAEGRQP